MVVHLSPRRLILLLAVLSGAACSPPKPSAEALRVVVERAPLVESVCARVFAKAKEGPEQLSEPIRLADLSGDFRVAVYRGEQLPAQIVVGARGYAAEDCTGEANGWSDEVAAAFQPETIGEVRLQLHHAADADGDGHLSVEHGGADCDDGNRDVHPGADERCDNTLDDDCSGDADCKDAACAGASCAGGGTCSPVGGPPGEILRSDVVVRACTGAREEVDCADGVDNDGNGRTDCEEPSCHARSCQGADLCVVGQTCAGGVCQGGTLRPCASDNPCEAPAGTCEPSTGRCIHPRKAGAACEDGNPCTHGDSCDATGTCVAGEPRLCIQRENGCLEQNGSCDAGSGECRFAPRVGAACDDGNLCSAGSSCDERGVCTPSSVKLCNAPPNAACYVSAGTCNPSNAGCAYEVLPGKDCNDADPCTVQDTCSRTGRCTGTPKCTTDNPCQVASCSRDGTCALAPGNEGGACPTGQCRGGVCRPPLPLPFPPSNFTAPDAEAFSAVVNLSCVGTPTFDSSRLTFTGWCGSTPRPKVKVFTQKGGSEAVLLTMRTLTVASSVRLRLIGDKPVILAVSDDATIDGFIDVGSTFGPSGLSERGAGASSARGCDEGAGGAGVQLSVVSQVTSGGGGGGGFGTPGARGGSGSNGAANGTPGAADTSKGGENLVPLRGGCSGGSSVGMAALGGEGGGAVQLTVGGRLSVRGVLSAAGAGGRGGASSSVGGGGGGSGGAVFLEASDIVLGPDAAVTANGGAGGESHTLGRPPGEAGDDGRPQTGSVAAGGNTNGGPARLGAGGNGAAGSVAAAVGESAARGQTAGGGGGGGGAGRIRLQAASTCQVDAGTVFSPRPHRTGRCSL